MGASVSLMPYTVFQRIGVGDLKPTRMTIQLADGTSRKPMGIIEDIPVRVGRLFIPADFVVIDMKEDKHVPIILGRPFLRTAGTNINMRDGTMTMYVGNDKVQFQVEEAMRYHDYSEDCCRLDVF
ncbi:retropepsin-like aspartic protease, partial [Algimonas porphyrae]|uniref:retropepsin-like aspartic protease n=1 Tax=Algimonas porphyrae TaxID=1128113 RepID=UPI0024E0FE46